MLIFHLWLYEWKRMFKHPGLLLFVFIFPIAIVGIIGLFLYSLAQEELDSVSIVVLDEDQTFETKALIKQLQNDETIDGDVQFVKGNHPLSYYLNNPNSHAAVVQVPKGFTKQLRSGVNEKINVYLNESLPLASNLAFLLMESGQDYISAAQAGVNTVNHFYIKQMEDIDERRKWIQQMTLHFTFYALNRNEIFLMDESPNQDILSWITHVYLIVVTILLLLTYGLMTLLFQPKKQPTIEERLRLINIKRFHQLISEFFHQITFLGVYLAVILWGLSLTLFQTVEFSWMIYVQWLTVGFIISLISTVIRILISQKVVSHSLTLLVIVVLFCISGLIIPPTYLPSGFNDFTIIYEAFVSIWVENLIPRDYWGLVISVVIVILSMMYALRKVGSS